MALKSGTPGQGGEQIGARGTHSKCKGPEVGICCGCLVTKSDPLQLHWLQHARLPFPSVVGLELAQTQVNQVGGAVQPSHPLSSPSPPAFNFVQHQGLSNESALCIR